MEEIKIVKLTTSEEIIFFIIEEKRISLTLYL